MDIFRIFATGVLSYFLGCLSLSIFLSKRLYGKDVRSCGSGNAGATNMARVYGLKMGILTLLADAAKAVAAMGIGMLLAGDVGVCIGGCMCIIGHCFPALHGFKGGKGVSVGAAVVFFIDWRAGLISATVFFIVAVVSKRISLGSICAAITVFVSTLCFGLSSPKLILAAFTMVMVVWRHKENIKRLLKGEEPPFRAGGKK